MTGIIVLSHFKVYVNTLPSSSSFCSLFDLVVTETSDSELVTVVDVFSAVTVLPVKYSIKPLVNPVTTLFCPSSERKNFESFTLEPNPVSKRTHGLIDQLEPT